MTEFFKKSKKPYFWAIFAQIWTKMNFPEKKRALSVFRYSIIYHRAKNQKKILSISEKTPNWRTDRQTDNGVFVGPSIRRGSNNW